MALGTVPILAQCKPAEKQAITINANSLNSIPSSFTPVWLILCGLEFSSYPSNLLNQRLYYYLERCHLEVMSIVYYKDGESPICLMKKALIAAYCFTCSIKESIPTFFL